MVCPKCKSENVTVATEQVGGKTKSNNMGCLWTLGRWTMIICTLGLWLVIGKRKETHKTSVKNQTVGICQSCGHKWKI